MILNFAVHITKPEKEASKKFDEPTVGVTQKEPSNSDYSQTSFSEKIKLFKASKEDDSQSNMVIGISVGISSISLVAMFLLMMNIVSKKKKKEIINQSFKNETRTPQFKIVPINRSNLKSSRFQPPSNFNDLTGCFPTEAKDTSIQGSDFTCSTEFDYYDYTNHRVDGCYGNGGTVVHV